MHEDDPSVMDPVEKLVSDNTNMYLERSMTCTLALWSTLAGIDGVFVSAASIIAAVDGSATLWFLVGILACCTTSMICLLLNFRALRRIYRILSTQPLPSNAAALDAYKAWLEKENKKAPERRADCERREKFCYLLLAVSILFIVCWIYTKHFHVHILS
jgi:hypothetical protein